jgi:hypothetical protein
MAIYERYRMSSTRWADLIAGDKTKASQWKALFDEHPEFFRPSTAHPGEYALVWRRAGNNRYHRGLAKIIERDEIEQMSMEDRYRYLSRPPVPEGHIKTLLDTAINLHQKAVEARRDRRWWIAPLIALVTAVSSFMGAIAGALIKVL